MKPYLLPNPARCREIPKQFSWVDHRLVRDGYFQKCRCEALALYLFLLTVADEKGVSYYGQARLMKLLNLDESRLVAARDELIRLGMIAYQAPYFQVLRLDKYHDEQTIPHAQRQHKGTSISDLLAQLKLGVNHD